LQIPGKPTPEFCKSSADIATDPFTVQPFIS
jgi:hypothetical protein